MPKTIEIHDSNLYTNMLHLGEDKPEISVVMPAYNASRYIAKTIQSILQQDFENFELIIADDCSTDNTVEIISSFNDQRIRLIHTERNTGSAKYPRELAIEQSRAPYICWIDSDDTVDQDYLSQLLTTKIRTGADIVCSQMLAERDNKLQYTLPNDSFNFDQIVSGRKAVMMTLGYPWIINLNGWLCNKDLWLNISSFKSLIINQMDADDFSAREILFNATKVAFSSAKYHYRLHSEAITKKVSDKTFESVITHRQLFDYFSIKWPEVLPFINNSLCLRMISLIRLFVIHEKTLNKKQRVKSEKTLRKYFKKIRMRDVVSSKISTTQKMLLLFPFGLSLRIIKHINRS